MQPSSPGLGSVMQLIQKFDTVEKCEAHLAAARWPDGAACPHCGSGKVYKRSKGFRYVCGSTACRKNFTVRSGTIFADSKVPLQKWFVAMYLMLAHKKGVSSVQLATDIGVTQKTAWFMLHRIQHAARNRTFEKPRPGVFEADEAYIGGKAKWKHYNRRSHRRGRNNEAFQPVFGIRAHDGTVYARSVADTSAPTIREIMIERVARGSILHTDEWKGYNGLALDYDHRVVYHGVAQYVAEDGATTNGIENFWSHLKRTITGTHHWVSPNHLDSYVGMSAFRYNERSINPMERIDYMLNATNGRRLTYNTLKSRGNGQGQT